MTRSAAVATLAALTALAAIIAADLSAPAPAQAQSDEQSSGQIIARLDDDDRIEFGWRTPSGAEVFPKGRYFPDLTNHSDLIGKWLRTSLIVVEKIAIGRINARQRADGRIEFAFTPTDGERILPPSRLFPRNPTPGRWLSSTKITISQRSSDELRYTAVSAGSWYVCGLRTNGQIACWGSDSHGQSSPPAGSFTAISKHCGLRSDGTIECWSGSGEHVAGGFAAISTGWNANCGLRRSGAIVCWGSYGNELTPPPAAPAGKYIAIAYGESLSYHDALRFSHYCAIHERGEIGGEIACWGDNAYGEAIPPEGKFTDISASGDHTCAIRTSGAVECWGHNEYGKAVPPDGNFTAVSAGYTHTCGLRTNGEIACWGSNRGYHATSNVGKANAQPGTYTAISAGTYHTCAIRISGELLCWGDNHEGQRDGMPQGLDYTAVAAGTERTCASHEDGAISCWGGGRRVANISRNAGHYIAVTAGGCGLTTYGEIWCEKTGRNVLAGRFSAFAGSCAIQQFRGTIVCWGSVLSGTPPLAKPAPGSYTTVSAGHTHSCGVRTDGEIECWGDNKWGKATPPAGLYWFTAVSTGADHSCGLSDTGVVECWGRNDKGEGGYSGKYSFTAISAGRAHTCVLHRNGEITCRGENESGQAPYAPSGTYTAVSAGWDHTCVLRESGEVQCWGVKDLDDRYRVRRLTFEPPKASFRAVSAGRRYACGLLTTDGRIVCWGEHGEGRTSPDNLLPAGSFSAISVGQHSCALRNNGEIECWGENSDGQTNAPRGSFRDISVGALHTCGVRTNGAIECWGNNEHGQSDAPPR